MKKKININYSIVSRGTEIYNNCGYISVSEKLGTYRYLLNVDHGILTTDIDNSYIKFNSKYSIENISFSKFQLITALMYEKHNKEIKDNILILGLGNIGITCLFYLIDKKYTNITIYVKKITDKIKRLISIINDNYNIIIKVITTLEDKLLYNTFIDTTGSSSVLEKIFENIDYNKTIIILSTPREEKYFISPLTINRKNLTIIGGHELNGVEKKVRTKTYKKLLKTNERKKYLKQFINIYNYSLNKLEKIKDKKENFIEIFKY